MPLSQNFIKDPFVVKELLKASSINSSDLVVEIGPGRGIITKQLLSRAKEVIAIEKDQDLYTELLEKFNQEPKLKLINKDFLVWNLPDKPYKVFSNIPFSITAEIVDKFLKSENRPNEIYLILQTEAAEKYLGGKIETQNSIMTKIFYNIEILGEIDRTAFTPKPQINITFIKFVLKNQNKKLPCQGEMPTGQRGFDYQQFRDFVIFGFNQWKEDIFNAYKKIFSYQQFKNINKSLKINQLKPSQLKLDQWLAFFDTYQKFVPISKKDLIDGFERKYLSRIRAKK
ncbi:MAG: rRNA adenine dimethyltransferase family protein [Candidatus Shapirobacteria bacterium]|nr:rRNA adenine dimethyltransferase family protein [Candidatus Shapirobacteria bacterium]